ncbi:MAG: hypothetical protein HQ581_07645 [Planctomycetes bacterium]|nr:hypothetical protein [Planctomycetota bacterium]
MQAAGTLIRTVGTSLIAPNLSQLRVDDPDSHKATLAESFAGTVHERLTRPACLA